MTIRARELSWPVVASRRMRLQGLDRPMNGAVDDVVAAMCGAHAQLATAAELSIGLRHDSVTRSAVRAALRDERSLVKTFGPRGTVHLLPTRDLPNWIGALAAIPGTRGTAPEGVRLTDEQRVEIIAVLADALRSAELTAEQLDDLVIGGTGPWAGELVMPAFGGFWPRWRQAIVPAAHCGVLAFGADRGRRVTYTNPAVWVPGFTPAAEGEATRWLLRAYLHAYGPATARDYAGWLAAPVAWATMQLTAIADELTAVRVVDGESGGAGHEPGWMLARDLPDGDAASDLAASPESSGGVRLLPYFDPYVVAGRPRDLLFAGAAADRALKRGQAGVYPVLLIDGVVAGVWHLRRSGRRLAITVEPLRALTRRERNELDDQIAKVGVVAEGVPELTIGPVPVGPHA